MKCPKRSPLVLLGGKENRNGSGTWWMHKDEEGVETFQYAVVKRKIYTIGWDFVFRNWMAKF